KIPVGEKAHRSEKAQHRSSNRPVECREAFRLFSLFRCLVSQGVSERVFRLADCLVELLEVSDVYAVLQGVVRKTELETRSISARVIAHLEKFVLYASAFRIQRPILEHLNVQFLDNSVGILEPKRVLTFRRNG